MYNYDPNEVINNMRRVNESMDASLRERGTQGYSQALGKPNGASIALGAVAGALTAKLIFDIFDR